MLFKLASGRRVLMPNPKLCHDAGRQSALSETCDALDQALAESAKLRAELATVRRERDEMFRAFDAYKDAVSKREAAQDALIQHYRGEIEWQRVRAEPPRWLH